MSVVKYVNIDNTSVSLSNNAVIEYSSSNSALANANYVIDSFDVGYRSAKYQVQVKHNTSNSYQVSEILLIHDGTTSLKSELTVLFSNNELSVYSSDVAGGLVRLIATPTVANCTFKFCRTMLQG